MTTHCKSPRRVGRIAVISLSLTGAWTPAWASTGNDPDPKALNQLSLEELANVEITSVSRHAERLSDAPASVYVITADAIRRAGATTLPQALRLAPNLQVAQVDASQYAISARGFNNASALANKLLVLIDGRTVYSPAFSGVFWDQQDVMLQDIDRIEIVSGPGATLWGANAVNGVINVITRPAEETQGTIASALAGNLETQASGRYGAALANGGHFRVYAKSTRLENTKTALGASVPDGWKRNQMGFRADWPASGGSFTVQGDAYASESESRDVGGGLVFSPIHASGANMLARWTRQLADGSTFSVQGYVDHADRDDAILYRPTEDIADLEFQHAIQRGRHRLLWGGGYRRAHDDIRPGLFFGFIPASETTSWTNLFLQDELRLNDRLELTLGAKLEHNGFTGTEYLPSARLAWKLSDERLVWAAVSRAVRAPSRLDRDVVLPPTPPFIIAGGPNFVSEVANVVELGYRATPSADLSYSITAFHHQWDRLRSGQPPLNAQIQNMIDGSSYGVEAWGSYQASARWRLGGGFNTLHKDLRLQPGSTDPDGPRNLGDDPRWQWMLQSSWSISPTQDLDATVRRVNVLPDPPVPGYTAVDLRYAARLNPRVQLSVTAQNLLDRSHPEFGSANARSEIGRSVFVQCELTL